VLALVRDSNPIEAADDPMAAAPPRGTVAPATAVIEGAGALGPQLSAAFAAGSRGASSAGAMADGLVAVRDALIARGHYAAEVTVDSLSSRDGSTQVHLRVRPGDATCFESVDLAGATTTKPSSAAAIAGLRPGRPLTPASLVEARDRLEGSGLFRTVGDPRVAPGSIPGRARVVIPVEEATTSRFEGAIGVADEAGVTGLVDLALGNIAGTGRAAGLRWAGAGNGRSDYAARYREPALLGRAVDVTVALDAQIADSLYTQTRWSLEGGARPWRGGRASLSLARSGIVYSGLARGASQTWSLSGRIGIDRLRPSRNPMRGAAAAAGAEIGRRVETYPGYPRIRRDLARTDGSIAAASPLGDHRALYGAVRFESVSLPGGDFPAEELRFVGGSEGLRGHRDRAYGGDRIFAATVEHRWIGDERGGRVYLFADAARHEFSRTLSAGTASLAGTRIGSGAAESIARTVLRSGWDFGYGAGLKSRVASGLVGLEFGFAPGEPLRRATIHLRYASNW
jgi:outer membrane protein assembly factor BamA